MPLVNIDAILSKKSIMAYLELKGHKPVRSLGGGRYSFRCPFPDHSETKPSFMVWTQSEHENFYCFGCQRHHNIIHLVAGLEGWSFKQAAEHLSDGLGITIQDEVILKLERNAKIAYRPPEDFELSEAMLMISSYCRSYLESVNYAESEVSIIDKLYAEMDSNLIDYEFDRIEDTVRHLPFFLGLRFEKYEELKLEEMAKNESRKNNKASVR